MSRCGGVQAGPTSTPGPEMMLGQHAQTSTARPVYSWTAVCVRAPVAKITNTRPILPSGRARYIYIHIHIYTNMKVYKYIYIPVSAGPSSLRPAASYCATSRAQVVANLSRLAWSCEQSSNTVLHTSGRASSRTRMRRRAASCRRFNHGSFRTLFRTPFRTFF